MKKLIFLMFVTGMSILLTNNYSLSQEDKYAKDSYNIEGVFTCDWNGNYYVRQIGNEILWYGEDVSVNPT